MFEWDTDFLTSHCTVVLQQQCDNATLIRFIYTYIHTRTAIKLGRCAINIVIKWLMRQQKIVQATSTYSSNLVYCTADPVTNSHNRKSPTLTLTWRSNGFIVRRKML